MTSYVLHIFFLLFVVIGFLVGVQSLVEWRRVDRDDYERRFLNKHKTTYHNAQEKKKEHD